MMKGLRKLPALVSRYGWTPVLRVAALWLARQVAEYRSAIVYCLDLDSHEPSAHCDEYDWGYKDAVEISSTLWKAAEADLPALTNKGDRFFVGTTRVGAQCYFSVVSTRGFTVPGRIVVTFSDGTEAYVGNCITLDEYRGTGIYPCGLLKLGRQLRSEGKRRMYLFVESENLASIRGVEKAGFRPALRCSVFGSGRLVRRQWRRSGSADSSETAASLAVTTP